MEKSKKLTKEPTSCVPTIERYVKNQNPFWGFLSGGIVFTIEGKSAWQQHPYSWWSIAMFFIAAGSTLCAFIILIKYLRQSAKRRSDTTKIV